MKVNPLEHRRAASKQPQRLSSCSHQTETSELQGGMLFSFMLFQWHAWHFGKACAMGISMSSYGCSLPFLPVKKPGGPSLEFSTNSR